MVYRQVKTLIFIISLENHDFDLFYGHLCTITSDVYINPIRLYDDLIVNTLRTRLASQCIIYRDPIKYINYELGLLTNL
jgi:hypothetical protein